MTRRELIAIAAGAAANARAAQTTTSIKERVPGEIPDGIAAILAGTLARKPESLNTDWFGTCLIHGLLQWSDHIPEARDFGKTWLDYHLRSDKLSAYSGNRSRQINAGGIRITTYAGHFGLAFACYELFKQTGDARARKICLDIADILLHKTARNRFGMVGHDDFVDFAIPDVCYFVAPPLMIASTLDTQRGWVYRDQAVYQLRTYLDHLMVKETKLPKTVLFKDSLGKTYWSRATGWMLWSITGTLRHMEKSDPEFLHFASDLKTLAEGIADHQDPSGGIHLYVDDPKSPLEITGSAMCALGLHEAVRKGWLPDAYRAVANRFWQFVRENISADGKIHRAYTLWAIPAENGQVEMDGREMDWVPGFMLSTAKEMTRR